MKIILSRKGFDGTAGGKPSIVYQNNFYSFPIPQNTGKGIPYKDLIFDEKKSYADVFKDLGIKDFKQGHLDPDLNSLVYERKEGWKPLFGQASKSEAQLTKNEIMRGDIFLFFGWFNKARKVNEKISYDKDENYSSGFHSLYGYFQVDRKIDLVNNGFVEKWMEYHPHYSNKEYYNSSRHNSIYVSIDILNFSNNRPGAGLLSYNEQLILTKKNKSRGIWLLDQFFSEEKPFSKFKPENGKVLANLKGHYPQELMISGNPKIVNWAKDLITKYGNQ